MSRRKKRLDTLILLYQTYAFNMVPEAGLEPARPHQTLDFESNASTDSTIRARRFLEGKRFEL